MVRAYDYPSAVHVDQAGIDICLVGDLAGESSLWLNILFLNKLCLIWAFSDETYSDTTFFSIFEGIVVHGHEMTLPITIEDMLLHYQAIACGAWRPLLVGDLPFGSYEKSIEQVEW